jgi:hypothetical protein
MIWQEEKKENNNLIKVGYWFLILSILMIWWLSGYNYGLESKIAKLDEKIGNFNNSINEKQKDKRVQVYNLLKENKKVIEDLDKKSKINVFINHIRELQNTYWILFKGFNYSNWVVALSAYIPFNSDITASNRASYFIKNYREDKNALFDLDFINTFNWYDSMTFNVSLKLK